MLLVTSLPKKEIFFIGYAKNIPLKIVTNNFGKQIYRSFIYKFMKS